jgi:hypothetical protein
VNSPAKAGRRLFVPTPTPRNDERLGSDIGPKQESLQDQSGGYILHAIVEQPFAIPDTALSRLPRGAR